MSFCNRQNLNFIIGCDANAHHTSWGSSDINPRGEALFDYLISHETCVVNEGNDPTFSANGREEVLDLTICNSEIYHLIEN